jgi:curli biogenesis system outer membrane secretion channel CsgG
MKSQRLVTIVLCLILSGHTLARAQDMDSAISKLTEDVAAKIKDNSNKKVTVLDFTDLDGKPTALGKYVAEQLTVDFVMTKRDFSVLDRANLKRIMAENKMSVSGLVNPENAKKLGMFSGVDAMIFGTITPVGTNINVTVKIITTETAEIVGGAKTQFKSDDNVQQLLTSPTKVEDTAETASQAAPAAKTLGSQQFSNLVVSVDKVVRTQNEELIVNFTLRNKSKQNSIGVAAYEQKSLIEGQIINQLSAGILAADGTEFGATVRDMSGIKSARYTPDALTEIQPGESVKVSMRYWHGGFEPMKNSVTSITVQAQFLVNQNFTANQYANYRASSDIDPPRNCTVATVSLDIPMN